MEKKLTFKENYLVFVKYHKQRTNFHVIIALILTIAAILYYLS